MEKLKTFTLKDIEPIAESDIKAQNAADRKAYLKMLRELCPSKKMRQEAKRISKRKDSCETCAYCEDSDSWMCLYPHSDFYIEDLKIDACYEGVLRYLVKKAQKEADEEVLEVLSGTPTWLQKMVYNDNKMIVVLAEYILAMDSQKMKLPEPILDIIRRVRDDTEDILPLYEGLFEQRKSQ